jgi:hypothetical protein
VQKLQQNNNATILHFGKRGPGDVPPGLPPPLGESRGHSPSIFLKKIQKCVDKRILHLPLYNKKDRMDGSGSERVSE